MHKKFDHKEIEKKWRKQWKEDGIYKTVNGSEKPKSYVLDMFPYPSGEGLHVGHPKGYIATDIYSRFKRMTGHEVLHPMGWDAFGLPAENYAIKHKVHPSVAVDKNVARFKEQLEVLGFDYDWDREINTTDPKYYKWTQWAFLQMFKKGLAYESHEPINWCPQCQTGLANEDLESDGTCERCGTVVEQKPMRQWVLKIREYADRMLEDLDSLDWPEHIKELQRNWIGRSEGAEIDFKLSVDDTVTIFTTRPDTLFGATYMVLAPEHPLVQKSKDSIKNWPEVEAYVNEAVNKKEMDRLDATKEKTGVKLEGITATNPANGEEIPVYIADYVLAGYGTGAIMAVPAHDERDFAFAKKFGIEIKEVIAKTFGEKTDNFIEREAVTAFVYDPKTDKYLYIYRNKFGHYCKVFGGVEAGESVEEGAVREVFEETGYKTKFIKKVGGTVVSYFYHPEKEVNRKLVTKTILLEITNENPVKISEEEAEKHSLEWLSLDDVKLKVTDERELFDLKLLQEDVSFSEKGTIINSGEFDGMDSEEAKKAITEKVGGRMTKTYKLRDWVFSRQRYWGEPIPVVHCKKCGAVPVPESELPLVLPEVEHYEPSGTGESPLATIEEWVNTECPACGEAARRETNTMPQWAGSSWYYLRYMDPDNESALVSEANERYWAPVDVYVGGAEHATRHLIYARFWHKFLYDIGVVGTKEPFANLHSVGLIMAEDGRKMSKRWGNVINPDDIVELVGADTLRVYEMFAGPFENSIAWNQDGLVGARRFLERVYGLSEHITENEPTEVQKLLHKTIKKVSDDIQDFKFNTAISALMIFLNKAEKEKISENSYADFLRLLAPFAPHLCDELWKQSGGIGSIHQQPFPNFDEKLLQDDMVIMAVQINGKMRGTIEITPDAGEEEVLAKAQENNNVIDHLAGKNIKKVIYIKGRILNIVVA